MLLDTGIITMREGHPTDEKYNLPMRQTMFSEEQPLLKNQSLIRSPQPNHQFFMSFNPDHLKSTITIHQQNKSMACSLGPSLPQKYTTIEKKQPINEINSKSSFHVNDISVCPTEEDKRVNLINPIALADKDWFDDYKLMKLLKEQQKNMYLSTQIFGN